MSVRRDKIQLEVEINGQKAGRTYRDLRLQARNLKRELDGLEPGTEAFIKKSGELKTVNDKLAEVRAQTKGVAKGMEDAQKSGGKFATLIKGAVVGALVALGAQLASGARELIRMIGVLDSTERKFKTVFGNASRIVTDFARQNAAALGVTVAQYEGLATRVGDILVPLGFTREEAAKQSAEVVKLSGALAEWSQGQFNATEVSQILTKALTGERESLKQLGIVIQEADVTARLAAKGQKDLTGTHLQQAKAVANLELIYERSRDAQRAFATETDSVARVGSAIAATFATLRENLARKFLPVWRSVQQGFADMIGATTSASEALAQTQAQFNIEIETLKRGELQLENRVTLIDQINSKYGQYTDNLLDESATLQDIEKFQTAVNEAFGQRIILLATEEKFVQQSREILDAKSEELRLQLELTRLEKEHAKAVESGSSSQRTGVNITSDRLSTEITLTERAIDKNKEQQATLRNEHELTKQSAAELGLSLEDLNKILNPDTSGDPGGPGDGGDKKNPFVELTKEGLESFEEFQDELFRSTREAIKEAQALRKEADDALLEASEQFVQDAPGLTGTEEDLQKSIERIQREKFARIQALDELQLTEEQYQLERIRIDQETTIAIMQERLLALEIGSVEYLELQQMIADAEYEIQKASSERIIQQKEKEIQAKIDLERAVQQTAIDTFRAGVDLLSKDEKARAKHFKAIKALEAAQVLVNLQAELSNIFKTFSELGPIGQVLAIIQAGVSTARAFAAVNKIRSQDVPGFSGGGYTGSGIYRDKSGKRVAGVVHENEWVGPEWMTRDPETGSVIDRLERIRRRRGGFQEGGFATSVPDTTPVGVSDVDLTRPGASAGIDLTRELLVKLDILTETVARQQQMIRAFVVYEDIEDAGEEINEVRQRSAL